MYSKTDTLIELIKLLIVLQKWHVSALVLAMLFLLPTVAISMDIVNYYRELFPFQGLWQSLGLINQIRVCLLPIFALLTVWYFWGAIKDSYALIQSHTGYHIKVYH